MRYRGFFSASLYCLIGIPCGLTIAPVSAVAQFVPNDRAVSDPSVSIGADPSYDNISNTMVSQDNNSNAIWLAKLNPITADISPTNAQGQLLDPNGTPPTKSGNTPCFGYGGGVPYILYTKNYGAGLGLGEAWQNSNQVWTAQTVSQPLNRYRPQGTAADWAGPAGESYNYDKNGQSLIGWRNVGNASSEGTLSGALAQGGRYMDGENSILVLISVGGVDQVAYANLNAAQPTPVQVTFESEGALNPFSWFAPEFNAPCFAALIGAPAKQIGLYCQTGPTTFQKIYQFSLPASGFPYVAASLKAFALNGSSYVVAVAAQSLSNTGAFPFQPNGPSQIWIAGINPANPFFRRIDDPNVMAIKMKPKPYMTASGPTIYFEQRTSANSGNWVLHAADTGLGPDWNYDNQAYSGPWASAYRDGKNCSCTPFPVGDSYQEVSSFPSLPNLQWVPSVMGPEGNLYVPIVYDQSGRQGAVFAFNNANSKEVFQVNNSDAGSGLASGNGLIASNGDVLVGGNTRLIRYTSGGAKVWTSSIRGIPTGLKFTPEGNVLAFTQNGWFQVFNPSNGSLINEANVTPNRNTPCLALATSSPCPYITSPAVDPVYSRVFAGYTNGTGKGAIRAFTYSAQTHSIAPLWNSQLFTGNVSTPVLSSDYSRVYVQAQDGKLYALDAATGALIWSFNLGISVAGTPSVTDFGYILPGGTVTDSSTANYIGILQDNGASAAWAFQTTDYAPESIAASGLGNRFALMARRASDNALVLLVVSPIFGVISQTQVTIGPLPVRMTGVVLAQNGWIYVGTSGSSAYRAFSPIYATTFP